MRPDRPDGWQLLRFGDLLTESRVAGSLGDNARRLSIKLYGKGVVPKINDRPGSSATKYYRRSSGQLIYSKLDFLNGAIGIIPESLDGYESTLDLPSFDIAPDVDQDWLISVLTRPAFYRGRSPWEIEQDLIKLLLFPQLSTRVSSCVFLMVDAYSGGGPNWTEVFDSAGLFEYDFKLGEYVLQEVADLLENDFDVRQGEFRELVTQRFAEIVTNDVRGYFGSGSAWYCYPKVIPNGSRPYERRSSPKFR